jgi:two-component system nitrogen regulation response regulator GlnG
VIGTASRLVRRKVSELSDDDVIEAMEKNQWQILAAARQLGVSRPTVYKLLEAHPRIRFPANIAEDEIRAAWLSCEGNLQQCASRLMTPAEALRRHLGQLGLNLST